MALKPPTAEHRRETTVLFDPEKIKEQMSIDPVFHRKRVAAYARVSTEQDAQQNSYEAQINYYKGYIQSKPDWEFVDVYSDEGISGTSYKNRDGFNKMIRDAEEGKIDLILTKSISRFSRNTVDSLTVTRKLRSLGVEVFFEKENISSMDKTAELVFTMMSSIAQEESRSISENVRWGHLRNMEAGKVSLAWSHFLGYEKGPDGLPKIVEEEAKTVRTIFNRFLEGASLKTIARELTESGVTTGAGNTNWTGAGVKRILTNEKYKGDAILQKTYIEDFLTKKVRINHGERKQWYVKDSHDAIVTPETFELVQKELARRTGRGGRLYDSPFTNKIVCGDCGDYYGHKVWHSNEPCRTNVWICNSKYKSQCKCNTPRIKDPEIERAFVIVANRLFNKRSDFIADYEQDILPMIDNTKILNEKLENAMKEQKALVDEIERIVMGNARHAQNQETYEIAYDTLNARYEKKKSEVESINRQISDTLARHENIKLFLQGLCQMESIIEEFDTISWHALVDYVKIMPSQNIIFHLRNGCEEIISLPDVM